MTLGALVCMCRLATCFPPRAADASNSLRSTSQKLRLRSPSIYAQRVLDLYGLCGLVEPRRGPNWRDDAPHVIVAESAHGVTTADGTSANVVTPSANAGASAVFSAPTESERRGR